MAAIPETASTTAAAIYSALERGADRAGRSHLGASQVGRPCRRELWYTFRWAAAPSFDGRVLRLFRRGLLEEEQVVNDLTAAGFEVHTHSPDTGRQFEFSAPGGHVGGSIDGAVLGIPEAPKTWHVLEVKTHGIKSYAALLTKGVEQSKPEHYVQCQLYMHWSGMARTLYVGVCKDDDRLYVERIRYDKTAAEKAESKANAVVNAPRPPERVSEDPAWYQCKMCSLRPQCHESAWSAVNCRTCCHATPESGGAWTCAMHEKVLTVEEQRAGCSDHVYIPDLVPHEQIDANEQENWVEYKARDGRKFRNGSKDSGAHTSRELSVTAPEILNTGNISA